MCEKKISLHWYLYCIGKFEEVGMRVDFMLLEISWSNNYNCTPRGEKKKKDTEQIITVYYNYKPMPSYKKYTSSTNPTKHAKPPSPVKLRSNVTQLDSSVYSPY